MCEERTAYIYNALNWNVKEAELYAEEEGRESACTLDVTMAIGEHCLHQTCVYETHIHEHNECVLSSRIHVQWIYTCVLFVHARCICIFIPFV